MKKNTSLWNLLVITKYFSFRHICNVYRAKIISYEVYRHDLIFLCMCLCNGLCNHDAYWTSCRLHAEQSSRTSCRKTKAIRVLPAMNVTFPIDVSTSSYNVDRLNNILSSMWTVLRNIHSVTVRLPRNNHASSTIIPVDWDVTLMNFRSSELFPVAKQHSVMDKGWEWLLLKCHLFI